MTRELKKTVTLGEFYGMTDRSGSRRINYKVAAERLAAVQDGLLPFGAPFAKFHHGFCKAIGEDFWASKHDRDPTDRIFDDDLQDSEFRSVMIGLSPAPIGIPTRIFRNRSAQGALVSVERIPSSSSLGAALEAPRDGCGTVGPPHRPQMNCGSLRLELPENAGVVRFALQP